MTLRTTIEDCLNTHRRLINHHEFRPLHAQEIYAWGRGAAQNIHEKGLDTPKYKATHLIQDADPDTYRDATGKKPRTRILTIFEHNTPQEQRAFYKAFIQENPVRTMQESQTGQTVAIHPLNITKQHRETALQNLSEAEQQGVFKEGYLSDGVPAYNDSLHGKVELHVADVNQETVWFLRKLREDLSHPPLAYTEVYQ